MVRGKRLRNRRLEIAASVWTNLVTNDTVIVPASTSVGMERRTLAARLNIPERMLICWPDIASKTFVVGISGDKRPGDYPVNSHLWDCLCNICDDVLVDGTRECPKCCITSCAPCLRLRPGRELCFLCHLDSEERVLRDARREVADEHEEPLPSRESFPNGPYSQMNQRERCLRQLYNHFEDQGVERGLLVASPRT